MNNTQLYNALKEIKNKLNEKRINDDSTFKGIKYNSYAPLEYLLYLIYVKIENDEDYKNDVINWLKNHSTVTTRDKIAFCFEEKIKNRFKNDIKYPLPYDNAYTMLDIINYKKENK